MGLLLLKGFKDGSWRRQTDQFQHLCSTRLQQSAIADADDPREAFIHNQHLVSVFFDLEKAYDTTWKYEIMKDLHGFGLRGRLPIFISNVLQDISFKVQVGSTFPDSHPQEMGVPQGSILSVTLFSVEN